MSNSATFNWTQVVQQLGLVIAIAVLVIFMSFFSVACVVVYYYLQHQTTDLSGIERVIHKAEHMHPKSAAKVL